MVKNGKTLEFDTEIKKNFNSVTPVYSLISLQNFFLVLFCFFILLGSTCPLHWLMRNMRDLNTYPGHVLYEAKSYTYM